MTKPFWDFFYKYCTIPHPSHYNNVAKDFLAKEITSYGLKPIIDKIGNIFFTIPASKGKEKNPSILLQAHYDMVGVCKEGMKFDFNSMPITYKAKGDFIYANNTSLGADNGIGLAYIMTIAKNYQTISHPKIEVLLTWDEEVSPQGIKDFNVKLINSRMMVNLDNEELSRVEIGCAGVNETTLLLPIKKTKITNPCYVLEVSNLLGGHSGAYIGTLRYNAIRMCFDFLSSINASDLQIIDIAKANYAMNVIPSTCQIVFSAPSSTVNLLKKNISQYVKTFSQIYSNEAKIDMKIIPTKTSYSLSLDKEYSKTLINTIASFPPTVLLYNEQLLMYELSYNIAKFNINDQDIKISYSSRAIKKIDNDLLKNKIINILNLSKLKYEILDSGETSITWSPMSNNVILQKYLDVCKTAMKTLPTPEVCKGGLECGFIVSKIPTMHAISFGPDIFEPHSINEHVSVSSSDQCYDLLLLLLSKL